MVKKINELFKVIKRTLFEGIGKPESLKYDLAGYWSRRIDGLINFFAIYRSIVNRWILVDNSTENFEFIAEGFGDEVMISSESKWSYLNKAYNG